MELKRSLPLGLLAIAAFASALQADDWTQWRGVGRDGAWNETGLLETFPADGLKVRWRVPVGPGYSSPVVARGRVYVTDAELISAEKRLARERVHCVEESTGRVLWTHAYDVAYPDYAFPPNGKQGPCPTPIVHEGRLYTVGGLANLHCLDAACGTVLWSRELAKDYPIGEFCIRGSPLIEGKLLIVPKGYNSAPAVIAIDKDTGKTAWSALDEGGYNSSPLTVTAGGKRQLIVPCRKTVASLDPATGSIYWEEKFECGIPTPVASGNHLLVNGMMFDLAKERPGASIVWPARKPDADLSDTTTAVFHGDLILSHRKPDRLVCLDAATGTQLWQAPVKSVMHTLARTPDGIFIFTDQGELIRARIDREGYRETARTALIRPTDLYGKRPILWASPCYANRAVFARNDEELICASLAADP